ncbi:hypothetical protein IC235_12270 [Hymenobacter sp. BT664]|uniref:Uncharacterized protein n=1 Tax=Hymenobacter montanus TaxID=2771359 RepID=A0A927BE06_9BACT|nr:hypothetical protein [Hymenobacter montanus]MBD2768661.1 hypothetical protein [Hymenobacter montanus]
MNRNPATNLTLAGALALTSKYAQLWLPATSGPLNHKTARANSHPLAPFGLP